MDAEQGEEESMDMEQEEESVDTEQGEEESVDPVQGGQAVIMAESCPMQHWPWRGPGVTILRHPSLNLRFVFSGLSRRRGPGRGWGSRCPGGSKVWTTVHPRSTPAILQCPQGYEPDPPGVTGHLLVQVSVKQEVLHTVGALSCKTCLE